MARKHLKRLVAPASWAILKKERVFITRPNPGPHTLDQCMPLSVILKRLGAVGTTREAKKALLANPILIDGKRATSPKAQVGLFDTFTIAETSYRMHIDANGHLITQKIPASEAGIKPCKIIGKTAVKGGKIQANTNDGRNILLSAKEAYSVGDTIMLSVPKQSISGHHKLEPGAFVFLTGGKHLGDRGTVSGIKDHTIVYKNTQGAEYTTLKSYAFVLGKGKSAITLP